MRTVYETPRHRIANEIAPSEGRKKISQNRLKSGDIPSKTRDNPPQEWDSAPPSTGSGEIRSRAGLPTPESIPLFPQALLDALLADCPPLPPGVFVEEIRLRADRRATLTAGGRNLPTGVLLSEGQLYALLVRLCGGSLYAYSDTIRLGYMTLPHGVRVGIAGRAVCEGSQVIGVSEIDSLCIRLPHRHTAVGGTICRLLRHMRARGDGVHGVLIYAPPGVGKTTLLRGVAARMASPPDPWRTVVIDTRGELGFEVDGRDLCLDILHGYPRARGVEIATRTLSAQLMICDEIGDTDEAMALISAHHGGVPLVASAHAGTVDELLRRTGIRLLHEARLFGAYVGITRPPVGDAGGGDYLYRITPWEDAERIVGGML